MTSHAGFATVALAAVLLLGGCTAAEPQATVPPATTPTSSESPYVAVDLDKEFRTIVDSSCDRAYEMGVTESVVGSDTRLVLVPVANAHNDFTAAVVNNDAGLTPIWSTEEFAVCIDSINFSMSEEGGSEYAITVSGDLAAGQLRSEYTVEDYGVFVTDYVIVDGLITEVTTTTPESTSAKTVRYGMPSDADVRHFREAIDAFLADQ